MHKHGAHGATDVTGFGIIGHASNLASAQKNAVDFVLHQLPVIRDMVAVAETCGIKFGLLQGRSAETSGISSDFSVNVFVKMYSIPSVAVGLFHKLISVQLQNCKVSTTLT